MSCACWLGCCCVGVGAWLVGLVGSVVAGVCIGGLVCFLVTSVFGFVS